MDFLREHKLAVGVVFVIGALLVGAHFVLSPKEELVTATVDTGTVRATVTVSGIAEATEAARLRFPDAGRISEIRVTKGDAVKRGDVLATIDQGDIDADRREAMARLSSALAARDQLVNGPTEETRESISTAVLNAQANVERVRAEEAEKVAAARRALIASDLALVPTDPQTNDAPPQVGGTYSCDATGTYTIEVYRSGSASGYSYRVSGLESGAYSAYTDNAGAFGACGLTLLFDEDEVYRNTTWTLSVPNTRGASYLANQNALMLAEERERTAVEAASDALAAELASADEDTADPRSEALRAADADIESAFAGVARVDALRERRLLRAPFDGTVTDIAPKVGEVTPANEPVITLVSDAAFEVIARIPEIDITKVHEDDRAVLVFDAKDSERVPAYVAFLSPLASPVDGVAYFDATITMDEVPEWVREGLNADVEIVIDERTDVARLPRRFIAERDGASYVSIVENGNVTEQLVSVSAVGTDGYAAVDLPAGTVVTVPTTP